MGSKLVNHGIMALAEVIGEIIRKGRPLPTVLGLILGAGLGATTGFFSMYLFGPAIGIGALTGTTVAAAIFRRPPPKPVDDPDQAWGPARRWWSFQWQQVSCFTVLMDRAMFIAYAPPDKWQGIVDQLNEGIRPDLESTWLIRYSVIDHLETFPTTRGDDGKSIFVVYFSRGKLRRQSLMVEAPAERDELIGVLEELRGAPAERTEEPMERGRAITVPLILVLITIAIAAGIALLSSHWTADPPPPPLGKKERDPLVQALITLGPTGVLLIAAAPLLALLGWLYKRLFYPPMLNVVRWPNSDASASN